MNKFEKAKQILVQFNAWRLGDENEEMLSPKTITSAINKAIEALAIASNGQWRSMDSAPHGEWLLVVDRDNIGTWQVCWNAYSECWQTQDHMRVYDPIYWIPLPKPPKEIKNA